MRIVCQQTILIEYHALYVIFEKLEKNCNCRLFYLSLHNPEPSFEYYWDVHLRMVC